MVYRSTVVLSLLGCALVAPPLRAEVTGPVLHMAWRAPYGQPGSRESLPPACGDSSGADSLYLTFRTGKGGPFYGIDATLRFRAAGGDTLGPEWDLDRQDLGFRVEFPPASVPGALRGWRPGAGLLSSLYFREQGAGRLQINDVLNPGAPAILRDSTEYLVARIVVPRRARAALCRKVVCVEWGRTDFAFRRDALTRPGAGGARTAAINALSARPCAWTAAGPDSNAR